MLKVDVSAQSTSYKSELPDITIREMLKFIRRVRWHLLTGLGLGLAVGLIYYWFLAAPVYWAKAALVIDPRRSQLLPITGSAETVLADNFYVQTQVALLKSESVLIAAIKAEKLDTDPSFIRQPTQSLRKRLFGSSDTAEPGAAEEALKIRLAVQKLQAGLDIQQTGLTNIIDIAYRSSEPKLVARVANAVARAYIDDRLAERADDTRRAGEWLQNRIRELREQSVTAARAVANFKTENKIIETPRGRMNEAQLGDLNSQIVTARALTAESQAKLARIEEILKEGKPDAMVSEGLSNSIINRLRNEYLDLSQREAEISAKLGPDQPVAVSARNQMDSLGKLILTELRRIAEGFRSDYEIAQARQAALETGLALAVQDAGVANQADVTMRELESNAQALKAIYDAFLQRYTNIVQVQSFPIPDARVVTEATTPLARSWPKGMVIFPISAAIGLFLALAAILIRDHLQNGLRSEDELQSWTGETLLGALAKPRGDRSDKRQLFAKDDNLYAPFADSLRVVGLSLQQRIARSQDTVVGFVSPLTNEGGPRLAANLAQLYGSTGQSVLLIDCDLRDPIVSEGLESRALPGVTDIAANGMDGRMLVRRVKDFDFLPAGKENPTRHVGNLISSATLKAFINEARSRYSIIIVVLPPVLPTADARQSTSFIDGFVLVVEWGVTNRIAAQKAIVAIKETGSKIIGAVFSDADTPIKEGASTNWEDITVAKGVEYVSSQVRNHRRRAS